MYKVSYSFTRYCRRARMKDPGFKPKLVWLVATVSVALLGTVAAQPPETGTNKSRSTRTKPQVIYHLPPASPYAATLHSQAKGQNDELPIDSSMPTSLQTSRTNANAGQQQTPTPALQQPLERPKVKLNRPPARSRSFAKPPGHGNPHGNKSHKR
jgi:hypothetical protein